MLRVITAEEETRSKYRSPLCIRSDPKPLASSRATLTPKSNHPRRCQLPSFWNSLGMNSHFFPRGQLCSWISYLAIQGPERTGVTGDHTGRSRRSWVLCDVLKISFCPPLERIPGTEAPSGLLSMGSHRVGHD